MPPDSAPDNTWLKTVEPASSHYQTGQDVIEFSMQTAGLCKGKCCSGIDRDIGYKWPLMAARKFRPSTRLTRSKPYVHIRGNQEKSPWIQKYTRTFCSFNLVHLIHPRLQYYNIRTDIPPSRAKRALLRGMDPAAGQADQPSRQDHHKKPPRRTRKRASRACLLCRARKVRCDVSQRGSPCTNCSLDNERCLVARRTSKYRRAQDALRGGPQTILPIDELMSGAEAAEIPAELVSAQNSSPDETPVVIAGEAREFELAYVDCQDTNQNITQDPPIEWSHNLFEGSFDGHPLDGKLFMIDYPFAFLEPQGCLKVPIRPLLDEFIQQYFLHVHPILPVVNECDFWDLYDNDGRRSHKEPIALLLFQAMLFAASTFVSQSTVGALGYSNLRAMRTTFLRRAKLLYDLESELSPLIVAQASVLLSTASLSPSGKPNGIWLSLAIENAKLAEAHLYTTITPTSHSKQRNVLKRLWWCCIIRDRSMGLLLKRPVQITKEQFNFSDDPLNSNDLKDELQRSKVYRPSTKFKLAEILSIGSTIYEAH
ncbi:hypothetical protein MRS44_009685 [Fusarium solani]|uniref:uncharacterized protein n=1 Tax=Fusarium solani TaxID=169388 RepID=UPI0032C44E78|nr:hypothetical protein MRS44_009685 [Fusarium solani]